MGIKEEFSDFIEKHKLIKQEDKLLVGLSGGMDSMVLCHLLIQEGFDFSIAHVNFKLRGNDSDQDELLVKKFADKIHKPLYTKSVDTIAYSNEKKVSIEMAAREIRYKYFDELCVEYGFDKIIVAHHLNDNIETSLLNLIKGTGLKGIRGMKPVNGKIVRPMLEIYKEEIEQYAKDENIEFRTDRSNFENVFQRNKIRNELMPILKEINPSVESSFSQQIKRFAEIEGFVKSMISSLADQYLLKKGGLHYLNIETLKYHPYYNLILFYMFQDFGFNRSQIDDIVNSLNSDTVGSEIISKTNKLSTDRNQLILSPLQMGVDGSREIWDINSTFEFGQWNFDLSIVDYEEFYDLKDPNVAYLDLNKIELPLVIRNWKDGDSFCPYGMSSKKKLSDFFVDLKVPKVEKLQIPIFLSGSQILWVAGYRVDNQFGITQNSNKVLKIVMKRINLNR